MLELFRSLTGNWSRSLDKLRGPGHSRWREKLQGMAESEGLLARCLHHLFIKHLLSTFCVPGWRPGTLTWVSDTEEESQPGRCLGAERAGRPGVPHPHPHRAITGLTVWDEVPLFWRNCSWQAEFQEVTNGEVLSSREWRQGRQRRERSGEKRTLTGVGGGRRKVWASQTQPFTAHRF